jgi:Permease family
MVQLGDYYAAARIAGAPVPPSDVISRAVAWQGVCCMITGVWGTGNGTTAYNENIGAMQVRGPIPSEMLWGPNAPCSTPLSSRICAACLNSAHVAWYGCTALLSCGRWL